MKVIGVCFKKGNFNNVPKDRCGLKLRTNVKKQICLSIQPIFSNETELEIERCFGVLVCPGSNVKHSDMKLLDMVSFFFFDIFIR